MLTERAKEIVSGASDKMQDALSFLEEDLKTYRVGKANPSIFNGLMVDYYGSPTPVHQVASISAPDAKTLALQPWEKNMIPKIEKAIMDANLGFTPQNNGEIIRCTVPEARELAERNGLKLYGAALSDRAADIRTLKLTKAVVAVGSEGQGLSREILTLCDGELIIPMSPGSESLNAAVAAAVILWEMVRDRTGS
jgi:ribosome recycling factor